VPQFQLVGPAYEAANPLQDAQRLINWYVEYDKTEGAKTPSALLGTPGLALACTTGYIGEVRGIWVLPNDTQAIAVVSNKAVLVTYSAGVYSISVIGTLLTFSGQVSIRDNGVAKIVVIVDGVNGYKYNINTNAFAQIADAAWMGSNKVSFIDGWFVFNKPNTQIFYTSPLYWNGTDAFDATYYSLKDSSSDSIVTHIEDRRELWLIGERTSEVWYDAGNQYFPFSRLQGALLQVGCAAPHTICRTGQGLIWLSRSERGENSIVMTQGYNFTAISTQAIANRLSTYATISDAFAYTYTEAGHEFYVITFPTGDETWVFDLSTGVWHQRASFDPAAGKFHRHRANCAVNFAGKRLVGDALNGNLWTMSRSYYVDGDTPLVSVRRAPHFWDRNDRNRIRQYWLQIEFTPGQGLLTGQGSDPVAVLRWSNDGGFTWPGFRQLSIGKMGEYTRRVIARRLGASRDRVYEVTVSDPVNRDVVGATLKVEANAS
jgi:hypothetical protein